MNRLFDFRFAYTLVLWLLLPYALIHLWWRARRQPEYLQHIGERFGRYAIRSDRPVIWLHTVSVGETRAAVTLVHSLRERFPDHQILLTHTTPTGRATSEQLFGDDVMRVYLPYDYPFAVRNFLRHFKPALGVLLETEIWFNLIRACHDAKIPLLLLNARLSDKSAQRYARFPRLVRNALHQLQLIAAQTEEDALRLAGLANRAVPVMGNLKFDIAPPATMLALGKELRERFGVHRRILLAASTREGEEALLLDTLRRLLNDDVLLVIVPRHPQRFDDVAALIEQRGLKMQRRSSNDAVLPDTQVVLGDSMGEMFAYYVACNIAFIGGSLMPCGGQNLIEACAVAKPVLIGPHTYNFAQATQQAVAQEAAIQVNNVEELAQQFERLLLDPELALQMGRNGANFVDANRGATRQALALVSTALNESGFNKIFSNIR